MSGRRRRRPALIVALLVLLTAAPVLTAFHHAPRQPLTARAAIRDALRSATVVSALTGTHWTAARASALDGALERVSFLSGSRTVAAAAVERDGTVAGVEAYARARVPFGDWIAYEPAVLVSLSALFILISVSSPCSVCATWMSSCSCRRSVR